MQRGRVERIKENISSDNKEDRRTSEVTGRGGGGPGCWADEPNPGRAADVLRGGFVFFVFFFLSLFEALIPGRR